ncbi:MAG: hypothetical protein JXR63_05860 [Spirochaetales bacterium]|nr:hypothetical protein [Spirochaetales bacterium]
MKKQILSHGKSGSSLGNDSGRLLVDAVVVIFLMAVLFSGLIGFYYQISRNYVSKKEMLREIVVSSQWVDEYEREE